MKNILLYFAKITKFALLCFVLCSVSLKAQTATRAYEGFLVFHYPLKQQALMDELVKNTRARLEGVKAFFRADSVEPVQIYFTRFEKTYQSFTGQGVPEWSQAVAIASRRTVIIKITTAGEIQRLPEVFIHELVHIFLYDYSRADIPVWIHEGIAQKLSKTQLTLDEKLRIGNALAGNYIIPFEEMDSLLTFGKAKAELAYDLAYTGIDFLMLTHGRDKVRRLLFDWDNRKNYDGNFVAVFGSDYIDFEIDWYRWLSDRFRWMVLLNVENVILFIFVLLLVAAFLAVKRRNYKKRAYWERTDEQDAEDY